MAKKSICASISCHKVRPTAERPGGQGTFIVRLSPRNAEKLGVGDRSYLRVAYGEVEVLACLSIKKSGLDETTVLMDQTIRQAICLDKIMQGQGKEALTYDPENAGCMKYPIEVQPSKFSGPSILARLLKQQYLICIIHHAMAADMETPIARITNEDMEIIGIQPGEKVLLLSETGSRRMRCLTLDSSKALPMDTMNAHFGSIRPCPEDTYQDLVLPWITLDLQTRIKLDVAPWHPIIVARDPLSVLSWELGGLASAIALSALGGAYVIPDSVAARWPWLPGSIILTGVIIYLVFLVLKIRSRI